MTERFVTVEPGVSVLDPAVGADTMAVLGAMMSRTPDLGVKIDRTFQQVLQEENLRSWDYRNPPARIRSFLEENVAGYGHASIASMAKSVFLYLYGFGWPSAWLLEDFPLFDGQEVSTRAVDGEKIAGVDGPGSICRHAPAELTSLHRRWLDVYGEARAQAGKGGWRFDDARVFLPGTIPTGVVITQDVRSIARQLDHIKALGGTFAALAEMGYRGLETLAPVTTRSIGYKNRKAPGNWRIGIRRVEELGSNTLPDFAVEVTPWDHPNNEDDWLFLLDQIEPRDRWGTHLDPLWKRGPRFRVSIVCTLAVARDFHRHRPLMPWSLSVCEDANAQIAMAPWHEITERAGVDLIKDTDRAFSTLGGKAETRTPTPTQWEALHALPFGTLVEISATASLPELVYMFELRHTTEGANPEYAAQARRGLEVLCDQLPDEIVEAEKLNGSLSWAREKAAS